MNQAPPSSGADTVAAPRDPRTHQLEMIRALVLGLATVASTWCAYQSTLWSGVQMFLLAEAGQADRRAAAEALQAVQIRSFDAMMFIEYIRAREENHASSAEFLYRRFRPEMQTAVDVWLSSDPFNNPTAPKSPFEMPEYVQVQHKESVRQQQLAVAALNEAHNANRSSDRYVLLTVAFASVLFFGGISGTFESRRVQTVIAIAATALFVAAGFLLAFIPISRG